MQGFHAGMTNPPTLRLLKSPLAHTLLRIPLQSPHSPRTTREGGRRILKHHHPPEPTLSLVRDQPAESSCSLLPGRSGWHLFIPLSFPKFCRLVLIAQTPRLSRQPFRCRLYKNTMLRRPTALRCRLRGRDREGAAAGMRLTRISLRPGRGLRTALLCFYPKSGV